MYIHKIINLIVLFFQAESISREIIEEEKQYLRKKSILDLINYIKDSIDIIVSVKVDELLSMYQQDANSEIIADNYEALLRKLEKAIRQHIALEQQFKIQHEKQNEIIEELKEDVCNLNDKIKNLQKEHEEQMIKLNQEIADYKKQKENFQYNEINLRKKLEIKNKEIIQLQSKINSTNINSIISNKNKNNNNSNYFNKTFLNKSEINSRHNNSFECIKDVKSVMESNIKKILGSRNINEKNNRKYNSIFNLSNMSNVISEKNNNINNNKEEDAIANNNINSKGILNDSMKFNNTNNIKHINISKLTKKTAFKNNSLNNSSTNIKNNNNYNNSLEIPKNEKAKIQNYKKIINNNCNKFQEIRQIKPRKIKRTSSAIDQQIKKDFLSSKGKILKLKRDVNSTKKENENAENKTIFIIKKTPKKFSEKKSMPNFKVANKIQANNFYLNKGYCCKGNNQTLTKSINNINNFRRDGNINNNIIIINGEFIENNFGEGIEKKNKYECPLISNRKNSNTNNITVKKIN